MTLQQLRYVVIIAEEGSFSHAAKRLYVSQPTITKAISELEKELNVEIFIRKNRGVLVSAQGMEIVETARRTLNQLDVLKERFAQEHEDNTIFHVSSLHYAMVADAFVEIVNENDGSDCEMSFHEGSAYDVMNDVREYKSELGILFLCKENESVIRRYLTSGHLKFTELFETKGGVYFRKDHPLAEKEVITFEELKNYPCLNNYRTEHDAGAFGEEVFQGRMIPKVIEVSCGGTALDILGRTDAYTLSPALKTGRVDAAGVVCRRLEDEMDIKIGYIYREGQSISNLGEAFLEKVRERSIRNPY